MRILVTGGAGFLGAKLCERLVEADMAGRLHRAGEEARVEQMQDRVLNAAAWTYVAGTLQSILTLLYLLIRANGSRRED